MTDENNSLAASALADSHCVLRPLLIMFARIFFDKKRQTACILRVLFVTLGHLKTIYL